MAATWGVRVVTEPAFEPVTLAEAKLWLRIDDGDTDQDAEILLLIIAMRERAEELTGRSFVQRTLEMWMDDFPADEVIFLPHGPVISVESVSYLDADGALQVLDGSPSSWQEDLVGHPARISPLYGTNWPNAREGYGAVRVQYVAGYANANAIPRQVRLWMQTRIATFYEQREQVMVGNLSELPRPFVDGLLDGLNIRKRFA